MVIGGQAQTRLALEVHDPADVAHEDESVGGHQHGVGSDVVDRLAGVVLDGGQEHAFERAQTRLAHGLPVEPAAGDHDHVDGELTRLRRGGVERLQASRHQLGRTEDEHDGADDGHRQSDRREVEQVQRLAALLLEQAGDHEVGRRADEGDHPTQHGRVAERHEVLRRRPPGASAPREHAGNEHADQRGVRDHARQKRGGNEELGERTVLADVWIFGERSAREALEGPGDVDRARQDVERGDGDDGRVAEAGKGLLVVEHAGHHQPDHRAGDDQQRGQALGDEHHDHQHEEGRRDPGVGGHPGDVTGVGVVGTGISEPRRARRALAARGRRAR